MLLCCAILHRRLCNSGRSGRYVASRGAGVLSRSFSRFLGRWLTRLRGHPSLQLWRRCSVQEVRNGYQVHRVGTQIYEVHSPSTDEEIQSAGITPCARTAFFSLAVGPRRLVGAEQPSDTVSYRSESGASSSSATTAAKLRVRDQRFGEFSLLVGVCSGTIGVGRLLRLPRRGEGQWSWSVTCLCLIRPAQRGK